mgnify:CR=1 FL=1
MQSLHLSPYRGRKFIRQEHSSKAHFTYSTGSETAHICETLGNIAKQTRQ